MPVLFLSVLLNSLPSRISSNLFQFVSALRLSLPDRIYSVLFPSSSLRFSALPALLPSTPCTSFSLRLSSVQLCSFPIQIGSNRRQFASIQCSANPVLLAASLFQINSNLLRLEAIRGISLPFRFFPYRRLSSPAQVSSAPFHSFSILSVSVRRVSVSILHISCLFRFHSDHFISLPIQLGALQRLSIPYRIASDQFHRRSSLLDAFPDHRGSFALSALTSQAFSFSN